MGLEDIDSRTINELVEQVDPFNPSNIGGRTNTPLAGYVVKKGGSYDLIIPEQEPNGHTSNVSRESRDYHAYNNPEIGGVVGIAFYKGSAAPVQNQYDKNNVQKLHLPSGPHDVLLFDGVGNYSVEKPYSVNSPSS